MMLKRIKKFVKSPRQFKLMLCEAIMLSIYYEICLRTNWSKKILKVQENRREYDDYLGHTPSLMMSVKKIIDIIEKRMPWKPMCYNRALTAKRMLRKRGIETTMLIGFRKKDGQFDGHAWITFNKKIVTGYIKGIEKFNVLKDKVKVKDSNFNN